MDESSEKEEIVFEYNGISKIAPYERMRCEEIFLEAMIVLKVPE